MNETLSSNNEAMRAWYRFIRLYSGMRTLFAARLRELDLTVAQCDMLATLSQSEGISQQELADRLYVTKGNISGLIDKLVQRGFVERRPSALSRRACAIHLTEQGRRVACAAIRAQEHFVADIFGPLPDHKTRALSALLAEVRALLLRR